MATVKSAPALDGKIEPFVFATDKDIERIANKGHTGFTGFVPTK